MLHTMFMIFKRCQKTPSGTENIDYGTLSALHTSYSKIQYLEVLWWFFQLYNTSSRTRMCAHGSLIHNTTLKLRQDEYNLQVSPTTAKPARRYLQLDLQYAMLKYDFN